MAPEPAPIIDVRALRREYGRFRRVEAVRGVGFAARRGEIFGLVGPDGAGKTSIIQMVAGVLRPHGGSVVVDGVDVTRHPGRIAPRIGYMPQGLGSNLYDSLTVAENIEFFRDLRQVPADVYARNRDELLGATRLAPFLDRRASTLSGGMRQKLALVCTLVHLPDILLLDEPTTGVDPISRQEFWQIIGRHVAERGATVLASTSYMDEAERCHRIALVHGGLIVADGTPASVRRGAAGRFARLTAEPQADALHALRARADVRATEVLGDIIHVNHDGELGPIVDALAAAGITVADAAPREPGLEDVFLQLVGGADRRPAPVVLAAAPPASADAAIECRGVVRRFGRFTAVDGVDLTVRRGEIFGLLGPNGAGKTTLIKMLCGLLPPDRGRLTVGGFEVRGRASGVRTAVGYMSQRFSLYHDLTVRQNLDLYASLFALPRSAYAELLVRLGLETFAHRLTKDLPAGVRQRVSLMCAVLHRPATVFLDEPTSGVDPQARRIFWDLIYSLSRDAGLTVLVSTHYMDEAVHCDRLGLMHQGRLIADGSPAEVRARSERRSGHLLAIRSRDPWRVHQRLRERWPRAVLYGDHVRIRTVAPEADRQAVIAALAGDGLGAVQVDPVAVSMDDAFVDCIEQAEMTHA
jgi:ABC-2 type transport system ATP-binding protein